MIDKHRFGKLPDGEEITLFTLKNIGGSSVSIINYGAIVTSIRTRDKNNQFKDIVLGFDSPEEYLKNPPYFGAVIGRVANRISHGRFPLKGKLLEVSKNSNGFQLHGGFKGFDKRLWKAVPFEKEKECGVRLAYLSLDGEEGYPGNLRTIVTYTLTDENSLLVDFEAKTDKTTVVNLTNHSYFNLKGEGNGTVYDHVVQIKAGHYTPLTRDTLVPTGKIAGVEGTPYDFLQPESIGKRISAISPGYDINFVLDTKGEMKRPAARVEEPETGRFLEVYTTQPGIQFYTGNYLENIIGKRGHVYSNHHAFCLETQGFPDAPNHPEFASIELNPMEKYRHRTIFHFGVNE